MKVMGATLRIPLLAVIPDFNSEELENLLHNLPIQDAAIQAPGMTMVDSEAVKVSYIGVQ